MGWMDGGTDLDGPAMGKGAKDEGPLASRPRLWEG